MNKRRWFIILAVFFLAQGITAPLVLSFETNSLTPATKLDLNYPEGRIEYPAVVFHGIGKYKILSYTAGVGLKGVQAPLSRGDSERSERQRGVSPYGQENSSLKVVPSVSEEFSWVLPSLNEILSDCKIKPRCTYSTRQVDSSL